MMLENYMKDMERMKEVTRSIVESGDALSKKLPHNVISATSDSSDYFNSYSHFGIHHDMLNVSIFIKLVLSLPELHQVSSSK